MTEKKVGPNGPALFLLRSFGDIDYSVPIIHGYLKGESNRVRVVLVDPFFNASADSRLLFLVREYGILLEDLFSRADRTTRLVAALIRTAVQADGRFNFSLGRRVVALLRMFWSTWSTRVDVTPVVDFLSADGVPVFVTIDNLGNSIHRRVIEALRARGSVAVMLPGGTSLITNRMWHPIHIHKEHSRDHRADSLFDVCFFGTREELQKFDTATQARSIVVGIPRYCDEWMRQSDAVLNANAAGYLNAGSWRLNRRIRDGFARAKQYPARLKLTYMTTFPDTGIWFDEMVRVIQLISNYQDVALTIKFKPFDTTPRIGNFFRQMDRLSNVFVVHSSVPSSALIDWSDAVIINQSSIGLEAFQKRKPVLYLRFLHSSIPLFDNYGVGWNIRCRDDLINALDALLQQPSWRPYSDELVRKFITEFIHAGLPDRDVLGGIRKNLQTLQANCVVAMKR